jgi:predicted O-methyltransferase YrrM
MLRKLKIALSYLAFRIKAKSRAGHSIHSPFVYSFVREVIYERSRSEELERAHNFREIVRKSNLRLSTSKFGSGSKSLGSTSDIKKLVDRSSVSKRVGAILFRLVKWNNPKTILEIGTSVGVSVAYLAAANPNTQIITLEGDEQRASFARKMLDEQGLKNVKLLPDDFSQTLPKALEALDTVDLVFVDGNHSLTPTIDYFNQILKKVNQHSVIVFDDIRWSQEMFSAWQHVANHSSVSVSIDMFSLGLVFFRKGIPKQHFAVNFL